MATHRELPSLNLLRAFEAAGRVLSFRVAAEALNVTPSAISHQVRELEDQLGMPLFVRSPRALAFTPEGQRYFTDIARAMEIMRTATAALVPTGEEVLKVSTMPLVDTDVLAPVLGQFLKAHPGLKIRLEGDWKAVDVAAGEADIAIRISNEPAQDAIWVCPVSLTLVCAPSLAADIAADAPASFVRHTAYRLFDFEHSWPRWCAAQGWPADTGNTVMMSSYRGLLAATAQGHGITLGTLPFVIDWLEDGRLAAPFPNRRTVTGQLSIVVRDAVRHRPDVVDFIGWMRELDRRTEEFFSPPPG